MGFHFPGAVVVVMTLCVALRRSFMSITYAGQSSLGIDHVKELVARTEAPGAWTGHGGQQQRQLWRFTKHLTACSWSGRLLACLIESNIRKSECCRPPHKEKRTPHQMIPLQQVQVVKGACTHACTEVPLPARTDTINRKQSSRVAVAVLLDHYRSKSIGCMALCSLGSPYLLISIMDVMHDACREVHFAAPGCLFCAPSHA
eukprot:794728-Pelagomonas_calceolata.AAC.6